MRPARLLRAALIGVALLAAPRTGLAQDGDRNASAQVLFDDALTLMEAGNHAEACPKLERSQQLDPGMGTEFRLAECYEKLGRIASAWTRYVSVAEAAVRAQSADRESLARKRAEALRPRLPRLIIRLSPEAAAITGLKVSRDGAEIDRALLDQPIVLDPGPHQLVVSAPGRQQVEQSVTGEETRTSEWTVPGLAPLPGAAAVGPVPPGAGDTTVPAPAKSRPGSTQRAIAVGAGVLGLGGVVVGSIFGLRAMSTWSDALGKCVDEATDRCDKDAQAKGNDASSSATVSTIGFGIGAVGLAAGAVLWITAPSSSGEAFLAPRMGRDSAGVDLAGRF
jgi:hypothetical protein